MKRYFVAECDEDGEAISESIFEVSPPPTWRAVIEAFALGILIGAVVAVLVVWKKQKTSWLYLNLWYSINMTTKTYEVEFKSTTYRHYYVDAKNKAEAEEKAIDELENDTEVSRAWVENSKVERIENTE